MKSRIRETIETRREAINLERVHGLTAEFIAKIIELNATVGDTVFEVD